MRTFISRILAGPIAALLTWLGGEGAEVLLGIETILTETAVLITLGLFGSLFGVVHKGIDRKVNPADDAT